MPNKQLKQTNKKVKNAELFPTFGKAAAAGPFKTDTGCKQDSLLDFQEKRSVVRCKRISLAHWAFIRGTLKDFLVCFSSLNGAPAAKKHASDR